MLLRRVNTKDKIVSVQSLVMELHTDDCSDNYNGSIEHERASLELSLLQIRYPQVNMDHWASTSLIPPDHPPSALQDVELAATCHIL